MAVRLNWCALLENNELEGFWSSKRYLYLLNSTSFTDIAIIDGW